MLVEDKSAIQIAEISLIRLDGQFQVVIPFREHIVEMPDNYAYIKACLISQSVKLRRSPELFVKYVD